MAHIFPIGGGKGGIGKSFIAVNLGVLLARQNKKVLIVDLDLGASNLHTFLGLEHIRTDLQQFLDKSVTNLAEVATPCEVDNLHVISSKNCTPEIANLFAAQKLKIIKALQKLPYDYLLLDLGAGTHFNTLDFFLVSDDGIIVFTPEPTSIENAFKFIKAVYLRKAKQILKHHSFQALCKEAFSEGEVANLQLTEIVNLIRGIDPRKGDQLQRKLEDVRFHFIINQFRKSMDATLGTKIERVCNRHFYSRFQFLGNISYDDRAYDSILSKKIFVNKYSYTISAIELHHICEKLLSSHIAEPSLNMVEGHEKI